jgi:hypothetical protein
MRRVESRTKKTVIVIFTLLFETPRSLAITVNEGSMLVSLQVLPRVAEPRDYSQYIAVAMGENREASEAVRTTAFFWPSVKTL